MHDVVAHHITGMVVQTQAARIVARRRPENLDTTLAGIEEAGGEALAAMRRVVGLLRDTDDVATTAPTARGPEQLAELVRRFDGHGPGITDPLRVVIVTTFDLDEYVHGALHAGAVGFVLKGAAPALLVEAVRAAHAGDALISPSPCDCSATSPPPCDIRRPARPAALGPRDGGDPGHRSRSHQPGDRRLPLHHREHCQEPPGDHPEQTRRRNRVEIAAWAWESRLMDSAGGGA
ncbi:hypothetical protein GCM10010193_33110 [Kitasatospora atroaurantiaca]